MMEKPTATRELFSRIQVILKVKDKPPDTFGYGLPAKFTVQR